MDLLEVEQPIVFRQSLGLRDRADFDVVSGPADRQIRQPIVFSFATAGADHHLPSCPARQLTCIERFGQGADLIDLQQQAVRRLILDRTLNPGGVGAEQGRRPGPWFALSIARRAVAILPNPLHRVRPRR